MTTTAIHPYQKGLVPPRRASPAVARMQSLAKLAAASTAAQKTRWGDTGSIARHGDCLPTAAVTGHTTRTQKATPTISVLCLHPATIMWRQQQQVAAPCMHEEREMCCVHTRRCSRSAPQKHGIRARHSTTVAAKTAQHATACTTCLAGTCIAAVKLDYKSTTFHTIKNMFPSGRNARKHASRMLPLPRSSLQDHAATILVPSIPISSR